MYVSRIIFLLLISISGFGQQKFLFVQGQGWTWVNAPSDSSAIYAALAARPTTTQLQTTIQIPFSQINSRPTTKAGYGITDVEGISAAATSATTGTITVVMTSAVQTVFTITPTGACTFNASGGQAGARMTFVVTTSGTSSFVLTFGTNFKSVGTLSTGTTTAKVFAISFVCTNGTQWIEISRTAAQ